MFRGQILFSAREYFEVAVGLVRQCQLNARKNYPEASVKYFGGQI